MSALELTRREHLAIARELADQAQRHLYQAWRDLRAERRFGLESEGDPALAEVHDVAGRAYLAGLTDLVNATDPGDR